MKKTLMKYISLALASTLLTSCVSFLDTNQNLNIVARNLNFNVKNTVIHF